MTTKQYKEKRWQVAAPVPEHWQQEFPELNSIVAQLLYTRGIITQEQIEQFLSPDYSKDVADPFLFRDMKKAVKRIWKAVDNAETILVYGDYDADGVSSTVILVDFLRSLNAAPKVVLPHRSKEGYGLNQKTLPRVIEAAPNLVITLDCGSTNVAEVAALHDKGIETIIVDHHHELDEVPASFALLNCAFKEETYPTKNLAAGGMTYKLVQGMIQWAQKNRDWDRPEGSEKWYLDLVAIATVADMVPLVGENRTLVAFGLTVLNKTKRPGLQALMKLAGIEPGKVTERHIGFAIAPRINAAGRMRHALGTFDLLTAVNESEALEMARSVQEDNSLRQKTTQSYIKEALAQVADAVERNDKMFFVYSPDWNAGLVGLVAGRLLEKYRRPVLVMTGYEDTIKGSGRSIPEFDITDHLSAAGELLKQYGGHTQACGFTLNHKDDFEAFKERMLEEANKFVEEEHLVPLLDIDMEIPLSQVTWELQEVLAQFAPFGQMAPKPCFVSRQLQVVSVEPVGLEQKHLRINVSDEQGTTRKTIAFGFGPQWAHELQYGDHIDLVYEVDVNEWNGNRELQLTVRDLKKLS